MPERTHPDKQKMHIELVELEDRIASLHVYSTDRDSSFVNLGPVDQQLIQIQLQSMQTYARTLATRLTRM
jgi:hypothetical protein